MARSKLDVIDLWWSLKTYVRGGHVGRPRKAVVPHMRGVAEKLQTLTHVVVYLTIRECLSSKTWIASHSTAAASYREQS